jgi:hypothetical protein
MPMTGMFEPGSANWEFVRAAVIQRGAYRLQHIAPADRGDLAAAAAKVGLSVYAVGRDVVELRIREKRTGSCGPRTPRTGR